MPALHAFIDESARGSRYLVCAAIVAEGDVNDVRRLARSLCVAGQRRWHFTKEQDSRRGQILSALVSSGQVRAVVAVGKGEEVIVRQRCLQKLGIDLHEADVRRLVIESREGRDREDRRVLHAALPQGAALRYEHARPAEDPCLWLADAVAWSYGAGGRWREKVEPIMLRAHDLGCVDV